MKSETIQTIMEFRDALSELNKTTVDLLLLELGDYADTLFSPYLIVNSNEYDNYYDFEIGGARFLSNQFSLSRMEEKLVYKRQSDREVYGFAFFVSSPYKISNKRKVDGNLLGVIYMKE